MLVINPIKTKIYRHEDDFTPFLLESLGEQNLEGKILAVTSKIVSIAEGCFISKKEIEKEPLIKKESDVYLGKTFYDCHLTIKHGLVIPSAGIDESNVETEGYLLFPEKPFASAQKIQSTLKSQLGLKNFGVIITDSKTTPLKRGVVGTCLSYYGFSGLQNKVGSQDLFGRSLEHTQVNICEALAAASTLLMGEADECQPLAIIQANVDFKEFDTKTEQAIPVEEDLYFPLFKSYL